MNFPLPDIHIKIITEKKEVISPLYTDGFYRINQREFSMDVEKVGCFYAAEGNTVEVMPYPGVDNATLELYLNGSTYGAILHQRGILTMHGSCFSYEDQGVMLCGESGAGKSSLTTSFVLEGNTFLTDDVTPLLFSNKVPLIWAMSDRVKLWGDSLAQLKQENELLQRIEPKTDKYYFPLQPSKQETYPLHQIFILEPTDTEEVIFEEINGSAKVTALRKQIYRPEYLQGMPDNEALFFKQLIELSKNTTLTRIKRSIDHPIKTTQSKLKKYLTKSQ